MYEYHAMRLHANLGQIAFYKKKKAKLENELRKTKQQLALEQSDKGKGSSSSGLMSWFGMFGGSNDRSNVRIKDIVADISEFEKEIEILNEL